VPLSQVSRSINQAITETVQKRVFFGEGDILLNPNLAPIYVFMTKVGGRKPTGAARVEFVEDDYVTVWGQTSEGSTDVSSVATNFKVVDATIFAVNDLIAFPKADASSAAEEIARVTAISGGTNGTLTVTRGIGGAGADTIGATSDIRVVAPAYAEGAAYGTVRSTSKVVRITYTQILRTPSKVTYSMAAQTQFGVSDERALQREKAQQEHLRSLESLMLWGRASEALASPATIRTAMGLKARITTNLTNGNGTLTETGFELFAESAFSKDYHGREKLLAAAPRVISALDFFHNGKIRERPLEEIHGVKVRRVGTTHGDFIVVNHKLLEDGPLGGIGWGDEAYSIDMDSVEFAYLAGNGENWNTQLLTDVVKDGTHVYADEWLTEGSPVIRHEARHARIYNVINFA